MKKLNVVSFRPGVISNGTAFEAQALIYKYLQRKYDWKFTIIKSEDDIYFDSELNIISIPKKSFETFPKIPIPTHYFKYKNDVVNKLKGYDLILGCDPTIYTQGSLAYYAAKKWGIRYVFDASLTIMNERNSFLWKFKKLYVKKSINYASLIWIPTPKTAERFRNLGLSSCNITDKFVVLGHPVDTNMFKPNKSLNNTCKINILIVSRLVMEKGIHYIIEASAPLIRKDSRIHLLIVGRGDAKGFLKKIAKDAGIASNVEFIDPVEYDKLPEIYNSSDLFVSHPVSISTWEEYFGVVNIEAMSCGLPVITSDCGGITYLAREKDTAIFVKERDIIGLTDKIKNLVEDKSLRESLGIAGRNYVLNKYSLPVIGEKFKQYIESL